MNHIPYYILNFIVSKTGFISTLYPLVFHCRTRKTTSFERRNSHNNYNLGVDDDRYLDLSEERSETCISLS